MSDFRENPRFRATERGELVVMTTPDGREWMMQIAEAHSLGDQLHDAGTRASGIEPRSGEPI